MKKLKKNSCTIIRKWWQKKPVYEVYVKSFKDSDSSGSGDLKGVTSKLDYLKNLGVGSVYLVSVFLNRYLH